MYQNTALGYRSLIGTASEYFCKINTEALNHCGMLHPDRYVDDENRWSAAMAAANEGDKAAYQGLLSELGDVIEAYVRSRFGELRFLEDCVQECLLALHNARHTYDPARPFRPWMFTIVKHKTIDLLRKAQRHADHESTLDQAQDAADRPIDERLHEMINGVRILESMTPDHRDAVALTQYAGLTIPEAARHLGITDSAFKARLRRGLIAIKKQLDNEDLRA